MERRRVSLADSFAGLQKSWSPEVAASVEEYELKVVIMEGRYKRHKHLHHDELILVWEGNVEISFDDGRIELGPGDCISIPKGTPHQSGSPGRRSRVLLFERSTIVTDAVQC